MKFPIFSRFKEKKTIREMIISGKHSDQQIRLIILVIKAITVLSPHTSV